MRVDDVCERLTPEHFENGRVPSRSTVAGRLAGVGLAQDFVEAIADICSRNAADTARLLGEARAARQRSKAAASRAPRSGHTVETAELVLVQQRSIEISDKLLRAQERMMQLERERNDANQMVLILLAMAEKLQRDIATLGRQRDRLDDAGPVREELRQVRERLTRSEEQRDTAESELMRARAERQKADELAEEAAAQVRLLTMQLAQLRGEAPDVSDPDGLAVAVSDSGEALASGDDIDLALSKATRHLDDRADRLDQLAEELHSDNFPDDSLTSDDESDNLPDNPPETAPDDSSVGPLAAFLEIRDYVRGTGAAWDSNQEELLFRKVSKDLGTGGVMELAGLLHGDGLDATVEDLLFQAAVSRPLATVHELLSALHSAGLSRELRALLARTVERWSAADVVDVADQLSKRNCITESNMVLRTAGLTCPPVELLKVLVRLPSTKARWVLNIACLERPLEELPALESALHTIRRPDSLHVAKIYNERGGTDTEQARLVVSEIEGTQATIINHSDATILHLHVIRADADVDGKPVAVRWVEQDGRARIFHNIAAGQSITIDMRAQGWGPLLHPTDGYEVGTDLGATPHNATNARLTIQFLDVAGRWWQRVGLEAPTLVRGEPSDPEPNPE
ncbi:hypothetical protein OID55_41455 [Streptomyces sp. NBC_00715]|uniref:hypothetical protein n=1 Tax=Streptomyces sp. NBC_00715 TaxID=2975811 RepID=UPI00386D8AD7